MTVVKMPPIIAVLMLFLAIRRLRISSVMKICHVRLEKIIMKGERIMKKLEKDQDQAVYMEPREYAVEHGEREEYDSSYKLNVRCAEALDKGIRKSFDGTRLDEGFLEKVVTKYGILRVAFVLANTVDFYSWDGRYSPKNKEWAENIAGRLTEKRARIEWLIQSHPAVIDGLVTAFRKKYSQ